MNLNRHFQSIKINIGLFLQNILVKKTLKYFIVSITKISFIMKYHKAHWLEISLNVIIRFECTHSAIVGSPLLRSLGSPGLVGFNVHVFAIIYIHSTCFWPHLQDMNFFCYIEKTKIGLKDSMIILTSWMVEWTRVTFTSWSKSPARRTDPTRSTKHQIPN